MNNLSQFILKKREEFDELFPTQETHASNGYPNGYADGRNETILEIQSHLLQSHIELLEEVKKEIEELRELCITDWLDTVCNCHPSMKDLSLKLSKTINEVKK